jgi:hypothetical protein
MSKLEKKAIVISPHQDDAAISLNEVISREYDEAVVVNIFTRSGSTIIQGLDNVEDVSRVRGEEDGVWLAQNNLRSINLEFDDGEIRGVSWDAYDAVIDQEILIKVSRAILDVLWQIEADDVFIPAAFGLHPDHLLALLACTTIEIQTALKDKNIHIYAEQPYYDDLQAFHRGHGLLGIDSLDSHAVNNKNKLKALECYPSQLSPEREERLSSVPCEYTWRIELTDLLKIGNSCTVKYKSGDIRKFGQPEWINKSMESFNGERRDFIFIHVNNRNGQQVEVPLVVDVIQLKNDKQAHLARFAGVDTSDYCTFPENFDQLSYHLLREQLSVMKIDALWLSNVRSDSALHSILITNNIGGNIHLLPNQPTVGLVCKDSYTEWLAGMSKNMRRNSRRKINKLETLSQERGEELSFEINPLNNQSLNTLLVNQSERAIHTLMDDLTDNKQFTHFLKSLNEIEGVYIAELKIGDTVISSLLIIDDEASETISIYIQSFNQKYENYSPSFCAIVLLIEHAHNKGYKYIDFLRGDEDYKRHFVDTEIKMMKALDIISGNTEASEIFQLVASTME